MLLCQPKLKGFEELPAYSAFFFTEEFPVDVKAREKALAKGDPAARLRELEAALATADFSNDTALEEVIKLLAAARGLAFGDYQPVARLALTGTNVGPPITGLMRVLGRERTLARLKNFQGTL
jgi:glutamyl/glutaminyl-tRNA synthetase